MFCIDRGMNILGNGLSAFDGDRTLSRCHRLSHV